MMFWDRHHEFTAWGSIGITLLFWVVIIALAVWLLTRVVGRPSAPGESAATAGEPGTPVRRADHSQ